MIRQGYAAKAALYLSCALSGLATAAMYPACAQTASPAPNPTSPTPALTSLGQPHSQIEEIVVTAERSQSTVQRTPLAIQAIPGAAIQQAGVTNAADLDRLVPSLIVNNSGAGASSFAIRGIGTDNVTSFTDSSVAFSLDQVYFSRAFGPDLTLFDLARVEVLKGPQGTLYGRNATAGAINVISNNPTDKFGGELGAEFGNYGEYKFNGVLNVPLTTDLDARIAFQTVNHNGYDHSGADNQDSQAGRIKLLWKPRDDVTVLLSGNYLHDGSRGPTEVPYANNEFTIGPRNGSATPEGVAYTLDHIVSNGLVFNAGSPANAQPAPGSTLPGSIPSGLYSPDGPYYDRNNSFGRVYVDDITAQIDWRLPFATLTVVPSFLRTAQTDILHTAPIGSYQNSTADQTSVEVRLASPTGGRLQWVAGTFFLNEQQYFDLFRQNSAPVVSLHVLTPDVNDETEAVFGQATYKIIDKLRLIGGLRFTNDDKNSRNSLFETLGYPIQVVTPHGIFPIPGTAVSTFSQPAPISANFSAVNFRAGLEYDVTPTSMAYATVSTGFHAGGIENGGPVTRPLCPAHPTNIGQLQGCDFPAVYQPERLTAFAVGSKSRFFGNRVQFNIEGFYWKYDDLQVSHLAVVNPGVGSLRVDNAGRAHLYGVDADGAWLITPNDVLSANVTGERTQYDSLEYEQVLGPTVSIVNNSGEAFANSPDWTSTITYRHTFDLANGSQVVTQVRTAYTDSYVSQYGTGNLADVKSRANFRTDLDVSWLSPQAKWRISGFVRNVANESVIAPSSANGFNELTDTPWVNVQPPRTFGVGVDVLF